MENLITVEEYKLAKDLKKEDSEGKIAALITQASTIIQTYLGREFSATGTDKTEVFSLDYNTPILFLDKYPVTDIVSVTEIDPYGYDSTVHWPVTTGSYYADLEQGKLIRTGGGYWPQGPGAVIVTYRAGYTGGVGNIPADLKRATIDLVTYYKDEEYKPSMQTRGATITNSVGGSRGQDYTTAFPPHIQRILDLYK